MITVFTQAIAHGHYLVMQQALPAMTLSPVSATQVMPQALTGEAQLAKVTIALVVVLLVIYLMAWLVRKNQNLRSFVGQPYKTLAMSSVGPKERIALIEIGSKQILLGITPHNINALATFDEPVMVVKDKAETDFAKKLKEIISHGKAER